MPSLFGKPLLTGAAPIADRSRGESRPSPGSSALVERFFGRNASWSGAKIGAATLESASGCDPIVIGLERQSEPFVGHPKIAVATNSDRVGSYGSDFLRNHPDIGLLAAVVFEAVVTKAIIEPTQQHDIMLQPDVRATTAAATTAAAESSSTSKASSATGRHGSVPTAGEPGPAAMTHACSRPGISGS